MPTVRSEEILDQQLDELERTSVGSDFLVLRARLEARPEYERIAAGYLSLLRENRGSKVLVLKVLRALDLMRARDISIQNLRFAPLAPNERPSWSKVRSNNDLPNKSPDNLQPKSCRIAGPCCASPLTSGSADNSGFTDCPWQSAEGTDVLDLSKVVLLHLGFVSEELVIALDGNLQRFFYGPAATAGIGKVSGKAFSELAYDPSQLDPDLVEMLPPHRSNARTRLSELAEHLHSHYDALVGRGDYPARGSMEDIMAELERLTRFPEIADALRRRATWLGCTVRDLCLVILPDEALYLLPLSYLGLSRGTPFVTTLGGVSVALSLVALKNSAVRYHYVTLPNMNRNAPHCFLFATDAFHTGLAIAREAQVVREAFGGERRCKVRVGSVTRDEFRRKYLAGDI